jgi:hypothetical protein
MKEINIVYNAHSGERSTHYDGPEGKVWISNKRNNDIPNVFLGRDLCPEPNPEDSFLMVEPVVVSATDYDINYLSKFRNVFGCFNKVFEGTIIENKYIYINYGCELQSKNMLQLKSNWLSWDQRKNGVIIVASGNKGSNHPASIYKLRIMLADFFYENNFDVSWYGYGHLSKPYYKGMLPDNGPDRKIHEICKYKFSVCTENTYDAKYSYNYLTEKLPHTIYGGAVPLYMGCYNIDEFVPKNAFFDLRNFVIKENGNLVILKKPLLEAIKTFSQKNFERCNDEQYKFMTDPNGISNHTDMRRYYKKMLEILC